MHDTLVGVASRADDHARALMSVHFLDFISHQSTYIEKWRSHNNGAAPGAIFGNFAPGVAPLLFSTLTRVKFFQPYLNWTRTS